jgi:soluble calcium-activated nucleotidase 1
MKQTKLLRSLRESLVAIKARRVRHRNLHCARCPNPDEPTHALCYWRRVSIEYPSMSEQHFDIRRLERYDSTTSEYLLAIITDEDHASQVEQEDGRTAWQSTLRHDRLHRQADPQTGQPRYRFEDIPEAEGGEFQLISLIAEGGRGAEFSELVMFGKRLVTFDDRTGLVCEVRGQNQLVPRNILMTGSGDEEFKGFKSEWATLWNDQLVIGSHGKKPAEEWVKMLDRNYGVRSVNWADRYQRIRDALGVGPDGYVIHEAAEWHPYRREWLFFPRKISNKPFDEAVDARERGANMLIIANEDFSQIRTLEVGERIPERGISSFKILPGHPNECVGLKSVEIGDRTESYLFCFNLDGEVLQDDIFIGDYKCEGLEIL